MRLGFGNNWVLAAIIVTVPYLSRPVALPVGATLVVKGARSKPDLACDLVDALAERFGDRGIDVVADAVYGCGALRHHRHGGGHRPRLPVVRHLAHRPRPRHPLARGRTQDQHSGYDIALVTTDLTATPEDIIARYAARWSIEVTYFDVKNILGVGQARNRGTKAVERTVPFRLFRHSLLIIWYALQRTRRHRHRTSPGLGGQPIGAPAQHPADAERCQCAQR